MIIWTITDIVVVVAVISALLVVISDLFVLSKREDYKNKRIMK